MHSGQRIYSAQHTRVGNGFLAAENHSRLMGEGRTRGVGGRDAGGCDRRRRLQTAITI